MHRSGRRKDRTLPCEGAHHRARSADVVRHVEPNGHDDADRHVNADHRHDDESDADDDSYDDGDSYDNDDRDVNNHNRDHHDSTTTAPNLCGDGWRRGTYMDRLLGCGRHRGAEHRFGPDGADRMRAGRLQGCRRNTWWYRIASSPWNSSYYVSADAFYNNGRTSGSLSGTPFVDPAVRGC